MKRIFIYYSYTGNTKFIAEKIRQETDCEVLEIKPKVAYSTDYQSVVDEYEDNEKTQLAPELEEVELNLNDYDEIIIASPVWWYTITPPIRSFLKNNDWHGKVVSLIATNAGWLGRTFKEMEKLCEGAHIKTELSIKFDEDYEKHLIVNEKEFNQWIQNLK